MTDELRPLTVEEWIKDRHANCLRIAKTKPYGSDRAGWMEDAEYFQAVLDRIATRIGEWRLTTPPTENNLKFDVWQSGKRVCDVYWSDIQETWCIDGTYGPTEPTPLAIYPPIVAWRPLPPPPETDDGP